MTEENKNAVHDKDVFQLERIALFSDAVFAIAITLLIIEIKAPDIPLSTATDNLLLHSLAESIPKFIGFFVSFFVISLYWVSHHHMFYYVRRYNQKMLWANIIFLLSIIIMPFSTAVYSEYFNPRLHVPIIVYAINISFTGLYNYRLWQIVGNPKYDLSVGLNNVILRYNGLRTLVAPGLFVSIALLSYLNSWIAFFLPPLVPLIPWMLKKYYRKKYPDDMKNYKN